MQDSGVLELSFALLGLDPLNDLLPTLNPLQRQTFWDDNHLVLPELSSTLLFQPLLKAELVLDILVRRFALIPRVVSKQKDRRGVFMRGAFQRVIKGIIDE